MKQTDDDVNEVVDEVIDTTEDNTSAFETLEKGLEAISSEEVTVDTEDEQPVSEDAEVEETEDVVDSTEVDEADEEIEEVPIPQEQVDIARKLGYSDDDIVQLAESNPERLEKMVELYSKPDLPQRETKQVEVPKKEESAKLEHVVVDGLEDLEPEAAKIISTLLKAHNDGIDDRNRMKEALDKLGEQTSTINEQNQQVEVARIDSYFDDVSEHIPEFGNTASLTSKQSKVREEVYGMAQIIKNSRGIGEVDAMEQATLMYGLSLVNLDDLEKQAEGRVMEKLNKQKKKMSPRPGGKKKVEKIEHGKEAALDVLSSGLKEIFS